ncbi:MAG: geranylgeranylglycerol-phosphate geranylgeranyltransferase [Bacteroidia bacterium]|nr:geranylgeranylglycerol-phosphate geranylgeranyltransferase [Bacteroidia bacterium]NND25490.1 geranylgeranylglycerol-phosphate geranylgeranyltransferase [Flavobacteriaceae bacterium]MBT8279682.1 geranylgeranylglycerol-phosphate geranylgeranyltransferase [Bacteroidia bacterium]NNK60995.1 geranylgeranylglycerol-phosphate geranylgeranyltransferase [Flavobacteriaceae bacterium]NNL32552.1 geranylgeranylglycerol-phosphate geranylgeranyltransferase [Flavobacteriaceae bacterium]
MIDFLNLIRWKNLLILAITQVLIKYALLEPFNVTVTLNGFGFSLLVLATVCIAAAGYVINDVYDIETDTINNPSKVIVGKKISEKNANYIFIFLTIFGVGLGFYLSNLVGHSGFAALFVAVSALLYVYASSLKKMILIGNIVISILVAISIIMVGVFELLPTVTADNQDTQVTFFKIILDYALFGFVINFIREIAKDIEDIDGDFNSGARTLPIIIGRERAGKVVFALLFVPLIGIIYYVTTYLYKHQIAIIYFLVLVVAPLIYLCVKSYSAETKKDWRHISNILKLVMLTGILSMVLYKYILLA